MGATGNASDNAAKYVIALDQGTTSSRAVLVDRAVDHAACAVDEHRA